MKEKTTTIEYQVVSLNDVARYFATDFQIPENGKLLSHDWWVDSGKEKMIFRLYIQRDE